ncbi:MAG: hypothetical protein E2579_20945 [Pseudomonas sp.]|nr:hypothetical protein [Pseudomonas sp.]WJH54758.1 hypothetical protein FE254_00800 [Pseudomonas guguanensis]
MNGRGVSCSPLPLAGEGLGERAWARAGTTLSRPFGAPSPMNGRGSSVGLLRRHFSYRLEYRVRRR